MKITGIEKRSVESNSQRQFLHTCFRGAFPPVDLRAVCLVRAMVVQVLCQSNKIYVSVVGMMNRVLCAFAVVHREKHPSPSLTSSLVSFALHGTQSPLKSRRRNEESSSPLPPKLSGREPRARFHMRIDEEDAEVLK